MCAVEVQKAGVRLLGTPLWFDARRKAPLSFVSHAHGDHIARHERVIATAETMRLMAHRLGKLGAPLPAPYHRPFELGSLVLELIPAGHMLGSAQLRVTRADGTRIVYTGDLNLQASATAAAAQVAECDVLVIESTFGHPRFRFPPREEVLDTLSSWLRDKLARGITPILFGYPMGKSQDVIKSLSERGFSLCAHPSIYAVSELYRELGVPLEVRRFDGKLAPGEVGVFPPYGRSQALRRIPPRATAVLTGWANEPGCARKYGADVAFPISDHADCASLISYARQTGAQEVVTHHGFAHELASELRAAGIFARAAAERVQLELPFS